MQKCENGQNAKKTVKMQECKNGQKQKYENSPNVKTVNITEI